MVQDFVSHSKQEVQNSSDNRQTVFANLNIYRQRQSKLQHITIKQILLTISAISAVITVLGDDSKGIRPVNDLTSEMSTVLSKTRGIPA